MTRCVDEQYPDDDCVHGIILHVLVALPARPGMKRLNGAADRNTEDRPAPMRVSFGFPPADLESGTYRVDVLWDDSPVWRTFFEVIRIRVAPVGFSRDCCR